jgi:hypothetical protein
MEGGGWVKQKGKSGRRWSDAAQPKLDIKTRKFQ